MSNQVIVDVVIPVYHPDHEFTEVLTRLLTGTFPVNRIFLMQTVKEGDTLLTFPDWENVEVFPVDIHEFDHGATRDAGIRKSSADFILCMTQDAVPADEYFVEKMVKSLQESGAASAFARQLPRKDAGILESFSREFNYPAESYVKSLKDKERLGIKTYFCSNVAAMYRREVYLQLGGFVHKTIFNEDMIFAGKVIEKGYSIAYSGEAAVIHSHTYTGSQQFHRNFDLGVSQADHPEVFQNVSSEKEGGSLVKRTVKYLFSIGKPWLIIPFGYQCAMKYAGYFLGVRYKKFSASFVKKCSMNKHYWEEV